MKIDTHNSLGHRFSSISDINRLIAIDYYRLQSILSIIEFHRLDTSGSTSVSIRVNILFLSIAALALLVTGTNLYFDSLIIIIAITLIAYLVKHFISCSEAFVLLITTITGTILYFNCFILS